MQSPRHNNQKIMRIVRRLIAKFKPEMIYLFGSYARGTARRDSDADLLVVVSETESRREEQIKMRVAVHDIRLAKDIVVVTANELERQKDIVGTVVYPAVREGKLLYARSN